MESVTDRQDAETVEIVEAAPRRKQAKRPAPRKKAGGNASGFYCYIGPSIRGVIQTGTVYVGTREDALSAAQRAVELAPLIKTLIVPGDTLADDRIKVKTPGTALYQNYRRVLRGK